MDDQVVELLPGAVHVYTAADPIENEKPLSKHRRRVGKLGIGYRLGDLCCFFLLFMCIISLPIVCAVLLFIGCQGDMLSSRTPLAQFTDRQIVIAGVDFEIGVGCRCLVAVGLGRA